MTNFLLQTSPTGLGFYYTLLVFCYCVSLYLLNECSCNHHSMSVHLSLTHFTHMILPMSIHVIIHFRSLFFIAVLYSIVCTFFYNLHIFLFWGTQVVPIFPNNYNIIFSINISACAFYGM